MKFKRLILFLVLSLFLCTGCTRSFDSAGYVTATLDALYKGDFSDYAGFTGLSTAEVSLYRSSWLDTQTSDFIACMGGGTPSSGTISRTTDLLKKIDANARYAITTDTETGHLQLTVYPIALLSENFEAIQNYVSDFNEKNEVFAYASLSDQDFYDTYMDGILTILESKLATLSYLEPVVFDVTLETDSDGLYTIPDSLLEEIETAVFPSSADDAQ